MKAQSVTPAIMTAVLASLFLTSCMRVDMYSQRNPQWHAHPLRKVMVIGNFQNLIYRNYAEGQMCEYIADYSNTKCLRSLKFLFAGQNESAQVSAVLNRQRVDGVIYISTQANGTSVVNRPLVFDTMSWSPGFASTIGFGGPVTVNWADYSVKLYTKNGMDIWYANADATGKPDDTIEHSSYHIAKELVKAGIITPGGSRHYKP